MNRHPTALILGLIAAVTLTGAGHWAFGQTSRPAEFDYQKSLAAEICRGALGRMAADPLTVEAIETSVCLIQEALILDPDNPDLWRTQMEIAGIAERDDLVQQSVDKLARLEPTDEVIRLLRLKLAIERYNTVEERLAAMQRLLTDENVAKMGAAVASRLTFDMALLYRRIGDNDAFATALARAMQLDPSNRSAAAMAAGYFRLNINDPLAEAELLVNLMLADPTDTATQVALAQHLLENGAYTGAKRIYELAIRTGEANKFTPTSELLMDQAVALWAHGDDDEALEYIRVRQKFADAAFRDLIRQKNKTVSGLELMELSAPIEPTTGTVRAAILASRKDPNASAALQAVIDSNLAYVSNLQSLGQSLDQTSVAGLNLEMALLAVWLSDDVTLVEKLLADAQKIQPLSPVAKSRFDGWIAYRRGEFDKAIELLGPIAPDDPPARCGLALAMLGKGQTREAATELLAVARKQPGTLIGVWASRELFRVLGRHASISPQANRMEQLIASINTAFDRYPEDSSLALGLRIIPEREDVGPYEPVILYVELTNQSLVPLALDKSGPIRPQLLLTVNVNSAYMPDLTALPPLVIDIGRRLRLMPHERMVVPVDLRLLAPGRTFNILALNGAILRIHVISNFVGTKQATVEPGMLGTELRVPLIRLEGVQTDMDWLTRAVADLGSEGFVSQPGSALLIAELGLKLATRPKPGQPPEEKALTAEAARLLIEVFPKLNPIEQAWVISVVPPTETLRLLYQSARESTHRIVQLAYLLFKTRGSSDPILADLKAAEDQGLAQIATLLEVYLKQVEDAQAREAAQRGAASTAREGAPPPGLAPPAAPPTNTPPRP